jgi:hypothetical protein
MLGMQIEKQRVRVVPDELETYRGVAAPTRKAVADKIDDAPVEIPKVISAAAVHPPPFRLPFSHAMF